MNHDFVARLASIVSPDELLEPSDVAEAMLVDERRQFRGKALAIVAPNTVTKIAAIVKLCQENSVGIVPQGGNTGYCGGATPDDSGSQLLLSLARLNRCREVDVVGRSITVEAGMILTQIHEHARAHDLLFPLSMGSEGSCQIGGNLSTNAGGLAVLKYGTARDLVLGLEVVTPWGEILNELKSLRKDTTGYDLKQLFVGAEGTLGIITAASLKLFPQPTAKFVCWLAMPNVKMLAPLLRFLQAQIGDVVSSFEYISRESLEYVLAEIDSARDPLDTTYQHYALVEFAGFGTPEVFRTHCIDALSLAQNEQMLFDAVIADSDTQNAALWALRETIPRAEKLLGGSLKHDVSIPISQMSELIDELRLAVSDIDPRARLSIYGHVGDGNVHFNVLPPNEIDYPAYKAQNGAAISAAIHDIAAHRRGSFSAEHGVGQLKTAELEKFTTAEGLELMRRLKRAFDPHNLMNPGKVVSASS